MSSEHTGREALEAISLDDRYVFHGSPTENIAAFVPQQVQSSTEVNGRATVYGYDERYIFATKYIDVAIFAALVWKRAGKSGWHTIVSEDGEVSFTFHASTEAIEAAQIATGYVYVLPGETFRSTDPFGVELVSIEPVQPACIIAVGATALRPIIDLLCPDPDD